MTATYTPPDDGRSVLERRQDEIEAERLAAEWQDHWDAIRKGEEPDPRAEWFDGLDMED
jgi:hypothetical protein